MTQRGYGGVTGNGGLGGLPPISEGGDTESLHTSMASTLSTAPSSNASTPPSLSISNQSKVERTLSKKQAKGSGTSVLLAVAKWLGTVLVALALTGALLGTKYSLLRLAGQLNVTDGVIKDSAVRVERTRVWSMLLVLLMLPSLFNLGRGLWVAALRKDLPWPTGRTWLWALLASFLESFGLTLFCLKVIPSTDAVTSLLLMTSVAIAPSAHWLRRCLKAQEATRRRLAWTVLLSLGLFCQVVVAALALYVAFKTSWARDYSFWRIVIAPVALNLAWLPALTHRLTRPREVTNELVTEQHVPDLSMTLMTSSFASHRTTQSQSLSTALPSTDSQATEAPPGRSEARRGKRATWKASIVLNALKLAWTPLLAFGLFYLDHSIYPSDAWFKEAMHEEFLQAWQWPWQLPSHLLLAGVGCCTLGYLLALLACQLAMTLGALALPVTLALLLEGALLLVPDACSWLFEGGNSYCNTNASYVPYLAAGVALACLGQMLSQGRQLFRKPPIVLQQESQVFWLPSFNPVALEQWLAVNRKFEESHVDQPKDKAKRTRVYICTTMYRETAEEMGQLLQSVALINQAQQQGHRFFESHVFFDNGVRKTCISDFALQLLTLLEPALGIKTDQCTKSKTPYGLKLSWRLPAERNKSTMTFNIHLKDNFKVKNKKRWSQVMYMSYVLDFLVEKGEDEDDVYILTTDADVVFTPASVEALLDLMSRDQNVGAVCARTHPLGNGPLVWYQTFEYAIGHWFQKAAEHILGSVLCAPGCFSVYRCRALRDVIPTYASCVEHAFDFLTKDMGEDRWLCTLLVQSGWRIDYCAAASNMTFCPEDFDEFYKQRRRWIASTIANLMELIRNWSLISHFNPQVSLLFVGYQAALLFSTLIGPSTVILFVSGGLTYAWDVDSVWTVVLQVLVCLSFALLCLYAPQDLQLKAAKLLTFLYAVAMTAVAVGTAEQIVEDLGGENSTDSGRTVNRISVELPVSVTTLYLGGLTAIFVVAAILHVREFTCLPQGIWYLLCLPSGYLVLNIYSVVNITDRSWGTREEATTTSVRQTPLLERIKVVLQTIFFCCDRGKESPPRAEPPPSAPLAAPPERSTSISEEHHFDLEPEVKDTGQARDEAGLVGDDVTPGDARSEEAMTSSSGGDQNEADDEIIVGVEDWLPPEFRNYVRLFRAHGFDNTLFISGMTERELKDIGVKVVAHVQYLLDQIKLLPSFTIEYEVPANVRDWLLRIGLLQYEANFRRNQIRTQKEMEILKSFSRKDIERDLKIVKYGHIKRLLFAIRRLRNPTAAEREAARTREVIDSLHTHLLADANRGEHDFWQALCDVSLKPDLKAFGLEGELKGKLGQLRNSWLMILAVTNTLWLILITTLASKSELVLLGANPLGLSFLVIFGVIFVIQFLCMLVHRARTLAHFLARAPYRHGQPARAGWAWRDGDLVEAGIVGQDSGDWDAVYSVRDADRRAREKQRKVRQRRLLQSRSNASTSLEAGELDPLLTRA